MTPKEQPVVRNQNAKPSEIMFSDLTQVLTRGPLTPSPPLPADILSLSRTSVYDILY